MAEFIPLHKPVPINPLIRVARYGMIISGVIYGYRRHKQLKRDTKEEQIQILKQIKVRDANKLIRDKIISENQMIDLGKECGVVPK